MSPCPSSFPAATSPILCALEIAALRLPPQMPLLSLLRKLKKSEKEARVLILGLDNAGRPKAL